MADEPVSALDVSIQAQILNLMQDLQRRARADVPVHLARPVGGPVHGRPIGVMYLGKLVEIGPADAVYAAPGPPVHQGLIDTVPVADPAAERAKEHQGVVGELPLGDRPAVRLPVPHPLPARAGTVRAERAAVARRSPARAHQAACHFPLREPEPGLISATESAVS